MAKRVDHTGTATGVGTRQAAALELEQTAPQGKPVSQSAQRVATPEHPDEDPSTHDAQTQDHPPDPGLASDGRSGILGAAYESSADSQARPSPSRPGTFPVANWDRYEFVNLLGRGGMGSVYKAIDKRLGRLVALKFVRGDDERLLKRFLQEARAQARIEHPGICKVLDVGEVEDKPYIAMQFVDGQSLQQATPYLSQDEKVQIIKDSAAALHAAHQAGILHRDIKPANIISGEKWR